MIFAPKFTIAVDRQRVMDAVRRVVTKRMGVLAQGSVKIEVVGGGQRGEDKNTMIANVQRKHGRNPFYLTEEQRRRVKTALFKAVRQVDGVRDGDLAAIAKLVADAARENIDAQRGPRGAQFTPLTPRYASRKGAIAGAFGMGGSQILVATGDLRRGLTGRVTKG